jgi:hypothetical protein
MFIYVAASGSLFKRGLWAQSYKNDWMRISWNICVNSSTYLHHSELFCLLSECPLYILVGRPEGRSPLGRPRRRWEDSIEMDLREIGFGDVDWIDWAQDRDRWRALVNTVMNLRVS